MKNYFIKEGYVHRLDNRYFNDTENKDEWQREVYTHARKLADQNDYKKIIDIGTGSAYKLLANFSDMETLGIDVPKTVTWLRKKYPAKTWIDKFVPVQGYDLIIASDVIEHISDPDTLLDLIENCQPKLVVFSTPERDLLKSGHNGPPKNGAHCREWNFLEFNKYISSRFQVVEHFISNKKQRTQVIVAKPL